jgi:hypothetical protein
MQVGLRLAKIGYEGQKVVELKYKNIALEKARNPPLPSTTEYDYECHKHDRTSNGRKSGDDMHYGGDASESQIRHIYWTTFLRRL